MDKKLDDQLVEECPNLYRDRHGSPQETCMCWGFDVGDGWFPLIYDLSVKLEKLILELPEEEREHCKASQVKEKFGGLRFYMDGATEEMLKLISDAETLSYQICEDCGAKGERRGGGWIKVLCDYHADKKNKKNPVSVAPPQVNLKELYTVLYEEEKDHDECDSDEE